MIIYKWWKPQICLHMCVCVFLFLSSSPPPDSISYYLVSHFSLRTYLVKWIPLPDSHCKEVRIHILNF